ncbi:ferredoxin [Chloroflexota bacterium]|nr:ferredoxin [Chloroflexota bacterium]
MAKMIVNVEVNGERQELLTEPYRTLLDLLRDNLSLTGTKEGCGTGDCGACTVLLDGRPVNSCLVLAPEAEGRHVTTVEGLAEDNRLHPIQTAFIDEGGLQCGICTPGMLMSAVALLRSNAEPSEQAIRYAISGNLCRCTGYDKIVRAIEVASKTMQADAAIASH